MKASMAAARMRVSIMGMLLSLAMQQASGLSQQGQLRLVEDRTATAATDNGRVLVNDKANTTQAW